MQRMFNLSKWRAAGAGEIIRFESDRPRTVRLEVNTPEIALLELHEDGREPCFLARVEGRDTIEFSADGSFEISCDTSDVYFYTAEGDDWSVEPVDGRTFTRIVERRSRNPEMEMMMHMAMRNMEQRLDAQAAELERRFALRVATGDDGTARPKPGTEDGPVNSGAGLDPDGTKADDTKSADGAGTPDSGSPAAPATKGGGDGKSGTGKA